MKSCYLQVVPTIGEIMVMEYVRQTFTDMDSVIDVVIHLLTLCHKCGKEPVH